TPVIYRGKITGYYKSYSDALAMFMLKGLKPAVYRDNAPLPINGPTHINITVKRPEDKTPLAAGENGGVRQIAIPLPGDAQEPARPEPGDDRKKQESRGFLPGFRSGIWGRIGRRSGPRLRSARLDIMSRDEAGGFCHGHDRRRHACGRVRR